MFALRWHASRVASDALALTAPEGARAVVRGVEDPAATSGVTSRPVAVVLERTPGRRGDPQPPEGGAVVFDSGRSPVIATGAILALGVAVPKSTPGRQQDHRLQGGASWLFWGRWPRRHDRRVPASFAAALESPPAQGTVGGTRRARPHSRGLLHCDSEKLGAEARGLVAVDKASTPRRCLTHLTRGASIRVAPDSGSLYPDHSWHRVLKAVSLESALRVVAQTAAVLADSTKRACSQRDRLQGRHASELPREG